MEVKIRPIVYKGAREICGAVGVPWKDIGYFIKHKGMPAFRIDNKGLYIALPDDMRKWAEQMRDEQTKPTKK